MGNREIIRVVVAVLTVTLAASYLMARAGEPGSVWLWGHFIHDNQ